MELPLIQQEIFPWVVGLAIGLPTLILLLGELIDRLQKTENPLAEGLTQVRHVALPMTALLLILRQVFGLSNSSDAMRLVESIFWLVMIFVTLTLIKNIAQFRVLKPTSWVSRIPPLFFVVGRGGSVFLVTYYILTVLWQVDVSNLFTAVGVGAVAISFALQDTLSNLVSGLLLLVERPFKVGDFLVFRGDWMQVVEIGWQATKLKSSSKLGHYIIPNGTLSKDIILNYEGEKEGYIIRYDDHITFSYDDPPNKVTEVLYEVLHNADLICKTPAPAVYLRSYQDSGIEYRMRFWFDFWDWWPALHQLRTQIYYAAKRHGLTIPYPTVVQYEAGLDQLNPPDPFYKIQEQLRLVPIFALLSDEVIAQLSQNAKLVYYGMGEAIIRQGKIDDKLYIIHSGGVSLSVTNREGQPHELARLIPTELFGVISLLHNESSPITATTTTDTSVLILDHAIIAKISNEHMKFGLEINALIDERKRLLSAELGIDIIENQAGTQNGWIELIRN
ncbi:MAG: mechanosensitive ion channel family protein [Chloroflexota bacterium]